MRGEIRSTFVSLNVNSLSTSETQWRRNKQGTQFTYDATLQCVRVTNISMHILVRSLVIAVGVDVAVNINVLWVAMEIQQWVPVEPQNVMLYNNKTIILKMMSFCMYYCLS